MFRFRVERKTNARVTTASARSDRFVIKRMSLIWSILLVMAVGQYTCVDNAEATLAGFDPGNIISDEVFYNSSSMSAQEIQSFLDRKVPVCASGYTCLKSYAQVTSTVPANAMCKEYTSSGLERASTILAKVAQACGVNPQVLLVTLQKEQGLVTSTSPGSSRYKIAMGYACPDTADCDADFFGFFNQVYSASWQFKRYTNPPGTSKLYTWYPVGKSSRISYHPNSSCGSTAVTIKNAATAGLYYYTPYQPNAAALSAGYSAANDQCSSYGNRNFYNYFTDWFGSTQTSNRSPSGVVTSVSAGLNKVTVSGWAVDPDTTEPVNLHIYAGGPYGKGVFTLLARANLDSSESLQSFPSLGRNHGFSITFALPQGPQEFCIYMINVGAGENSLLDCSVRAGAGGPPFGNFESATLTPTGTMLKGWTIDPDTNRSIDIHVYARTATGTLRWGGSHVAAVNRPDVGRVYKDYGSNHGFLVSVPTRVGTTEYCVYAIDPQQVENVLLGCHVVSTATGSPFGSLDEVTVDANVVHVRGWAIDPDTSEPIATVLTVDGVDAIRTVANSERPDVARVFPGYGAQHGFFTSVELEPGNHSVCVRALNVGTGSDFNLRCQQVISTLPPPFGNFESAVARGGSVSLSGWAIVPPSSAKAQLEVFSGGQIGIGKSLGFFDATMSRPDVGDAYPVYGPQHGFSFSVPFSGVGTTYCLYVSGVNTSNKTFLGCKTVN